MVESRQSDATSFPVRGTALTERDLLSLGGILFARGRGGNPGLGDTAAGIILITWCLAGCRVTGGRLSQRRGLGDSGPERVAKPSRAACEPGALPDSGARPNSCSRSVPAGQSDPAEQAVTGVAQSRHDISLVVQPLIHR